MIQGVPVGEDKMRKDGTILLLQRFTERHAAQYSEENLPNGRVSADALAILEAAEPPMALGRINVIAVRATEWSHDAMCQGDPILALCYMELARTAIEFGFRERQARAGLTIPSPDPTVPTSAARTEG